MPELIEVEAYRRTASAATGRRIERVAVSDGYVRGSTPARLTALLVGGRLRDTERIGKVLVLGIDGTSGPGRLGLRFGMTGRLVVDGVAPVDDLVYGSNADRPAWDHFVLGLEGGGTLRCNDPRRLGSVEWEPDLSGLGPDAATIGVDALAAALEGTAASLKACLLDQARLAGVGNLLADDALWRARLAPGRTGGSLDRRELTRLARAVRTTIAQLGARGGSHRGDLQPFRRAGGPCPRCGARLRRSTIGGRTTLWCPTEQR